MAQLESARAVDLAVVARSTDLISLLTRYLGTPKVISGKSYFRCPFHADGNPSLYVWADGRRWRCWPCGLEGDVLDFVTQHDHVGVIEAAKRLDPLSGFKPERRLSPKVAQPSKLAPFDDAEWQATMGAIVAKAETTLWGREGREALAWLHARGLADATIRRFRLGFMPERYVSDPIEVLSTDTRYQSITAQRGIVLPWPLPASSDDSTRWAGANIRRLGSDVFSGASPTPKCIACEGSTRGFAYPWPEILPTQGVVPALIVEGEFDALLANQELGHAANVVTVGGAGTEPHASTLASLARCPWWLIATDRDEAGIDAASRWIERSPHKARRAMLPHGKDLTDFVLAGGDPKGWLAGEFKRLNIR